MNPSASRGPRTSSATPRSEGPVPNPRRRRRSSGSGAAGTSGAPAAQAAPRAVPAQRPATAEVIPDAGVEVVADGRSFADLFVPQPLVDVLAATGVVSPFPIQTATLPDSMAGRDVLGRGRTGSGKTIAFALPLVTRVAASSRPRRAGRPRSLVLVPTRELANQVAATITPLAKALGLRTTVVFGGVGQNPQVTALREGVDVLIACPGRLEDLIRQGHCHLDAVEVTVLDEADHMADLGFLPGVKRLLDATPAGGQRLLFSATLDNGIDVLVKRYLSEPVVHSVDPAVAPVSTMEHHVLEVGADGKNTLVRELASGQGRTVLFTRTKHSAKKLAKQLTAAGIPAVDLHGNLSQNARERNLAAFSDGSVKVLCATDIAARGIHVDDVSLVVHVDPPTEHKAYLHRSGRTARAGAGGLVVTVATPDQRGDVRTLARQAGISPQWTNVGTQHEVVGRLVGPAAAWVDPADSPVPTAPAQPERRAKAPAPVTARRSAPAGETSRRSALAGEATGAPRRRRRGGRGRGPATGAATS
ncbi:superfamily II DNA/RNA helicase [Kineococcus radiotolerans]|uniref:Superfamily II DNA/RNA helicase n=1 Tax=Kineococcus radiotolerans TaxID=131568 RepID=A0A7W4TJK5_KINRA|nr:DEAD/DEAH box helicase [Kineococcus radiotolerans]MBB2900080.1 superfamily II DNA/RNA helicase [Kineococcus radiotolerans]